MRFLLRQFDQAIEMPHVAVLQQRVEQHRTERWRERERQARLHALAQPVVHDLDERDITLRHGLEKPVLLQKLFVVRMPDKRQVRVQDEGKVAGHKIFLDVSFVHGFDHSRVNAEWIARIVDFQPGGESLYGA